MTTPDTQPASPAGTGDKLRLGGMALRNGLLVHGPTSWAAAVRTGDGEIKTASGRKPRLRAADGIPGVRGVARLAEAMAVIPLVKRGLPETRLPFQDPRRARGRRRARRSAARCCAAACAAPAGRPPRRSSRSCPRCSPCAAASWPPTTASSTRRSARTRPTTRTRRDATKEHERCGSHLVAPMLAANLAGTLLLRRVAAKPGPIAGGAVAIASSAVAVEVFAWCERNAESPVARAIKRPGFEIQRLVARASRTSASWRSDGRRWPRSCAQRARRTFAE